MKTKKLWASKTFWLNILSATVAVASGSYGELLPAKIAIPLLARANIAIRIFTVLPVSLLPGHTDTPQ